VTAVVPEHPSGVERAPSAPWLVGLALTLADETGDEEAAVGQLLAEANGSRQALEGAYGRAVALVAEYPDDPLVKATCDLVARALHRVLKRDSGPHPGA
jgi:hypothetical protein